VGIFIKEMVGKKSVKKSPAQVRRDLDVFEKGIIRLKELEKELGDLDSRGFAGDEQRIRAKLKNVSDIPFIEREIKSLRLKINNKHKPRVVKKSPYKKIGKDLEEVRGQLPGVKRSIKLLNDKLDKIPKKKTRKIDLGVGSLVEADFDNFLGNIKSTLSERIASREKEIKDILAVDLQKRDVRFGDRYRALVREFSKKDKKLRDRFEKKYKERVATSLKNEVKRKFDSELNAKLKVEKGSLAKKYQAHLNARVVAHLKKDRGRLQRRLLKELKRKIAVLHREFDKRHIEIENGLKKRYCDKIKLAEKRRCDLDAKEKKFVAEKKRGMEEISRLRDIKNNKIKELQVHARKLDKERAEIKRMGEEKKKKFNVVKLVLGKRLRERERRRIEELVRQKALLESEKKEHNIFLEEEKGKLVDKIKKNNLELASERLALKVELDKHNRELDDEKMKLEEMRNAFQIKKKEERDAVRESLTSQISADLEKKLARKERLIRSQMKKEYDLMLRRKIQERDEELKKKKFALEVEIQKKMRAALR